MNDEKRCYSIPNKPAFKIPEDKNGKSELTGEACYFTCTEVEVFLIK